MSYARARELTPADIPVIDIAPLRSGSAAGLDGVARELQGAARGSGFFYVRNHGVPRELIDAAMQVSGAFFRADDSCKREVAIDANHRGFLRIGEASMYRGARPDLKESFIWGREVAADDPDYLAGAPLVCPNNWPTFLPQMRPVLNDYFAAVQACGETLLRAFAVDLGAAPDTFVRRMQKPVSRGALVYYPPQPEASGAEQFGVAPHTDYGTLTLVYQDAVGGLQVGGRDGEWVTAVPVADTFVVNVGDLLARWSNDAFRSTPHRVVNASGRERFSMALFVDPDGDTPIEPVCAPGEAPHYPPVRCADYITGRFNAAFAYRQRGATER